MKKLAIIILLALLFAALHVPVHVDAASSSSTGSQIRTIVSGPTDVLTGEQYDYTVTIVGAPDADRWGCRVSVSSGGSVNPANYSSTDSNVLTVHIKAPDTATKFTITVNGTADIGNDTYWNRVEYKVNALKPNTVQVPIYNSGSVDAKNVTVSLYIDGKYQYSTQVSVDAGKSSSVTLKWNPKDFSKGVHTMKIVIDPKSNLTFEGGKTTLVQDIYVGQMKENKTSLWIALAIVFTGTATIAFEVHHRKKKRMPKRKKW